jgi:phenylpyruvate tautomerase PptA (4-oxalocrotonate tautomerase family)
MGAKATTWAYLADYVKTFRALLRGDTADWNGQHMRMMHPEGHAPRRPIDVPVLISAFGPKGLAVAKELGDGLFTVNGQTDPAKDFKWAALAAHGTVLAAGEALNSPRIAATAGPGNALAYHSAYEFGGDPTALPAGQVWLDSINQEPEAESQFAVFDQHLVGLTEADMAAWVGRQLGGDPHDHADRHRRRARPHSGGDRERWHHRNHLPANRPGYCKRVEGIHRRRQAPEPGRLTVQVREEAAMPTYVCYTYRGQVGAAAKAQLAAGIARIHHDVTGAPIALIECVFHDLNPDDHFIGGQLAPANGVWVYEHIRGKRTSERNNHIIVGITDLLTRVLQVPLRVGWVYLNELPHSDMVEFGHVLPKPGDEQSWFEGLPSELRDHLAALDHSAGT